MRSDIAIETPGAEHAVLLIHGLMGNPLEMQYVARRLADAGFAAFAPHIRGYGFVAKGERPHAWDRWVAALVERFDELKARYARVSVCGLCIGALLAVMLAVRRAGRVSSLSLLATTLRFDGWGIPWYGRLAPLAYYSPLRFVCSYQEREPYGLKNAQIRNWIARDMRERSNSAAGAARLPMEAVYQAWRLASHVGRLLPSVRVPSLVMHAREDDVASLENAHRVSRSLGSSHVRLVVLENSYHMVTLDNDRGRVAAETADFFARHGQWETPWK
jgi:carboxylesterase